MEQQGKQRRAGRRVAVGLIGALATAASAASVSVVAASGAGAAQSVVISTARTAAFGKVLVSGNTVYTLKPSKTPCDAQCLQIWPAVELPAGVTHATAGPGVQGSKLGTVKMSDGSLQVTYGGKALYYFVGDKAPGQVNGNITDTWGKWSTVTIGKPTPAPAPSNSGSGGTNAGTGGASF